MSGPNEKNAGRKLGRGGVTRFKKGQQRLPNSGRKPGQANHMTIAMRDAVVQAMEYAGEKRWNRKTKAWDKAGPGGMLGYMIHLALHNEALFTPFAQRVLPMHVHATVQNARYKTEDEIRALCVARGISYDVMMEAAEPAEGEMIDITPERPGE
jgi:general stress protein YciG